MRSRALRTTRSTVAFALVALTAILTACSPADENSSTDGALQRFYEQELGFEACDPVVFSGDEAEAKAVGAAECAMLEVPLDYGSPKGATIELGLARVASSSEDRVGSVVVNPGGPGGSGAGFAPTVATAWAGNADLARFDVVGLDPRGVGSSVPAIDCYTDEQRENDAATTAIPPGALTWTTASASAVLEQCAESVGGVEALQHFGTRNAARDIDVLRAALGEDTLSFYGVSYGTRLGAVYAETFPQNVRALVLDGALDPTASFADRELQLAEGLQSGFERLAAFCMEQAGCPLGDDPTQATEVMQSLLQPLVDAPIVSSSGREVSYYNAIEGVVVGLYDPAVWPFVIKGIAELQQGVADTLLILRDLYSQRTASGTYSNSADATFAINCLDGQPLNAAESTELLDRVNESAPFIDPGIDIETEFGCAGWPTDDALDIPYATDIEGLPQTLVVSVTGDSLTPHEGGIALAETLGARLLTVKGDQHGAGTSENACIGGILGDYFAELRLPEEGATCSI